MTYDPAIAKATAQSAAAVSNLLVAAGLGTEKGLESFARHFLDAMYDKLNQPGTGIHYPGNPNPSSAPGEPPAPQTETYRDSWDYRTGHDNQGLYVDVGTPVEYGPYLEYGTSTMEPRPHLRPLVDEMLEDFRRTLVEQVAEAQAARMGGRLVSIILDTAP